MLKFLRNKKVMRRVFWGLAIIIIPAFTLWGVGSMGDKSERKSKNLTYAGKIYNKKISIRDYQDAYRETEIQAKLAYGDKFNEVRKFLNIGDQAWDRILLLDECQKNKISVSDKELSQKIASFKFLERKGKFDIEVYERFLKYFLQVNAPFFENTIRNSIKITKLLDMKKPTGDIKEEELRKLYKEENEKAKISYILYDTNSFKNDIKITDDEISKYYEFNKDDYKVPPQLSIDYLEFKFSDFNKDIKITDDDIKYYYDSHLNEFKKPEEVHARHILVKTEAEAKEILDTIKAKKRTFEDLAKEKSEDPGSKSQGGDLGFFAKGQMVKEFEDESFRLKPGEISEPIKTNFGYHIIKVEEKKDAYTEDLNTVKERIRGEILNERSRESAISKANEVSNKIQENPDNFEEVIKENKLELKTAGPFSKEGVIPNLGYNPLIQEEAFKMNVGTISKVLAQDDPKAGQAAYIIRLKEKFKPRIKNLSEVKEEIKNTLVNKKASELAHKKASDDYEAIKIMLEDNKQLDSVSDVLDVEVKKSNEFTKNSFVNGLGMASEISGVVFSLKVGELSKPFDIKRGTLIITLDELSGIDEKKFKEESEEFKKRQLQTRENTFVEDYLKELRGKSKIEMNITSLEELYE